MLLITFYTNLVYDPQDNLSMQIWSKSTWWFRRYYLHQKQYVSDTQLGLGGHNYGKKVEHICSDIQSISRHIGLLHDKTSETTCERSELKSACVLCCV